jgi:hypothetical protein
MQRLDDPPVLLDEAALRSVTRSVQQDGYWVGEAPIAYGDVAAALTALGRTLGSLYVPPDCDPASPIIHTAPTRCSRAAPFDRPDPIGWHGDFASHEDRPELSLVYIARADPAGAQYGAWRLASVRKVVERLQGTAEGREVLTLLSNEALPYCYAEGQSPRWFTAAQTRGASKELGLRFYEPSIERGCLAAFGHVPKAVGQALSVVKEAADAEGSVRRNRAGSLLITSNWYALHDRVEQTVAQEANREALLLFVR